MRRQGGSNMEQLIAGFVEQYVLKLLGDEVVKLAPELLGKLPIAVEDLARELFARSDVQTWVRDLEKKGVEWVISEVEKVPGLIANAVKQALYPLAAPAVAQTADGPLPLLHLNAAQVEALAHLTPDELNKLLKLS